MAQPVRVPHRPHNIVQDFMFYVRCNLEMRQNRLWNCIDRSSRWYIEVTQLHEPEYATRYKAYDCEFS